MDFQDYINMILSPDFPSARAPMGKESWRQDSPFNKEEKAFEIPTFFT